MMGIIEGKKILVTGGAGSIGSRLVEKLLEHGPKVVRIFDHDETRLVELKHRIKEREDVRYLLGDMKDRERLRYAVEGIDIVFHSAALKHVEECEYNPFEAVKTNVVGTQNVIDVATQEEVEKVIFTSSDKAVNPTNVMGATKLLCERLITAANYYKGARRSAFSSVRFGNVVGSSGSVIPVFLEQIRKGGPVTLTDPNMTRFIMSGDWAIELLIKATELAKGGEIFIFKMQSIKIHDLAQVMMEKFGKERVEVKVTGRKPGEKLYEELMTESEAERALETEDMFIVLPEIRELLSTRFEYPRARKAEAKSYRSCDCELLSKEQIERMLDKLRLEV
jgi:UDP-N-acetylglucosamine 4,6-dehydratase